MLDKYNEYEVTLVRKAYVVATSREHALLLAGARFGLVALADVEDIDVRLVSSTQEDLSNVSTRFSKE